MSATAAGMLPARRAEVDVARLRANAEAIVASVRRGTAVMAMVKANGYGHGAVIASRAFVEGGAGWLGVSSADEALELRRAGIAEPILNVNWTEAGRVAAAVEARVTLSCWNVEGVAAIAAGAREAGRRARVHLKADTGMGRVGARAEQMDEVLDALAAAGDDVEVTGFFTHYADADGVDAAFTEHQHEVFLLLADAVRDRFPEVLLHCANSAATLRMPHMHHDIVRPGIALYGYPPVAAAPQLALRPALRMVAPVTHVKTVRAGDTVGYGRTWRAERDTRVATVGAGYADGVHRALSSRGRVLIGGHACPMIGRVSMDQLSVDVSGAAVVRPGDDAVLIGTSGDAWLGADHVAAMIDTISYEVLCAIGARVPRVAV